MKWIFEHIWHIITGLAMAIFSYFKPIADIMGLMIIAILIDMVIGIIAARVVKGQGIKPDKVWNTGLKLGFSLLIVGLIWAMDITFDQIPLCKTVAWVITGWEVWSIICKATQLSNHKIFRILKKFMEDKAEDVAGVHFDDKKNNGRFKSPNPEIS